MAEVVVSSVVELLLSTVKQQIQYEIKLVRGVDKELLDLSDKLNKVRNKLDDADMKQFTEKTVKDWLRRLEKKSQETEDVLEEWSYAMIQHTKKKVCSFIPSPCLCFKKVVFRHDIAKKVQTLKSELDGILNEKVVDYFVTSQPRITDHSHSWRGQSISLIDLAEIHGRNHDKEILVKKLTAHEGLDYQILSIVGAGGLGKTTIAQLVYNDSRVEQCFDSRIWICVSEPFEVEVIAKGIFKAINGKSPEETTQLDDLLKALKSCISGKKFLLVLDDVWNEKPNKWEGLRIALNHGGAGSKILVTTRKEHVAKMMGSADEDIHRPDLLSDKDCLTLLMRTSGRSEDKFDKFREIGEEIAKKCSGLPLAAKTLGSVLLPKKTVQKWEELLKSEMWDLKHVEVELFPHLLLSYNELSPTHKRCFSFCAFFPKDEQLEVEELIGIWTALGYLGSNSGNAKCKGREVFEDLAMRSLFQNFKEDESTKQIISCKMHDIVHDFAQFLRKNGRFEDSGMIKRTCQVCNPYLVSNIQEYHSLVWDKESPLNICDCITSLRVLRYRKRRSSPRNIEKLIHLKWLDLSNTKLSMEDLETICKLYFLQILFLGNCSIGEVPEEIENLVNLRYLDLSNNRELKELPESICRLVELQALLLSECSLLKIPREIGKLVQLTLLDLSANKELEELPESICRLVALQTLLLSQCSLEKIPREIGNLVHLKHLELSGISELKELPRSMGSLVKLQILYVDGCKNLRGLPEELGQLSGLDSLYGFLGGSGCNKFGLLRNLNSLRDLFIVINTGGNSSSTDMKELIEDAREAELRNKVHLTRLEFEFINERDEEDRSSSSLWVDVMEALEPSRNLPYLEIWKYEGSRLPHWISSPLNLVRRITLNYCLELSSLPPMGKLPFLESLHIFGMKKLKVVRVEWLGIRGRDGEMMNIPPSSSSSSLVLFPKLETLIFSMCAEWSEWEDITAEQEESTVVSVMPCLKTLYVSYCDGLKMLPHRLLRKASSLRKLNISGSSKLVECYGDKDGSPRRSISQNNPQLFLRA